MRITNEGLGRHPTRRQQVATSFHVGSTSLLFRNRFMKALVCKEVHRATAPVVYKIHDSTGTLAQLKVALPQQKTIPLEDTYPNGAPDSNA